MQSDSQSRYFSNVEDVKKKLRLQFEDQNDKIGSENVSVSEVFDTKYRPELWNALLDEYDKVPASQRQKALKEVIMLDVKLFRDLIKANQKAFRDQQISRSSRLIASFDSSLSTSIASSEEFRENEDLSIELANQLENVLNYFYLIEFYIFPKLKHRKHQPEKGYWSFGLMMNSLMYKVLGVIVQTSESVLDSTFANSTLTKNLLSIALVAYIGFHPGMMLSLKGTQMYAIFAPILAKFFKWAGLFRYLGNVLSYRDTVMYIKAMNCSLSDTVKVLSELRELVSGELVRFLDQDDSEENEKSFFKAVEELINKFGCSFSSLEKFVENKTALHYTEKEGEDGWVVLEKEAKNDLDELQSTYLVGKR